MPLLLADLDDTILDRAGTFDLWVGVFLQTHGLDPGLRAWLVDEDQQGRRPRAELFGALKAAVKDPAALPESVDDLVTTFYRDFGAMFRCDPTVAAAIGRLRSRGWRVAVVTNGTAAQERKIFAAGLQRRVDAWAVSGIEGCWKPQVRLLEIAAERAGESLARAWMVGDNPEADIGGAHAAGIPSVWLRRGRPWPLTEFRPTSEADSFPEAVDLVLAAGQVPT